MFSSHRSGFGVMQLTVWDLAACDLDLVNVLTPSGGGSSENKSVAWRVILCGLELMSLEHSWSFFGWALVETSRLTWRKRVELKVQPTMFICVCFGLVARFLEFFVMLLDVTKLFVKAISAFQNSISVTTLSWSREKLTGNIDRKED